MAPGIDRILMLLKDEENIREMVAFPLSANGTDAMMGCPNEVFEKIIEISGTRILMMHGHLRSVKNSLYAATLAALEADADLLLYGHTHIPNDTYLPSGSSVGGAVLKKPLRIMNPGTSGKGCSPSYGVLTFRDGVLLTSHFKK